MRHRLANSDTSDRNPDTNAYNPDRDTNAYLYADPSLSTVRTRVLRRDRSVREHLLLRGANSRSDVHPRCGVQGSGATRLRRRMQSMHRLPMRH